MIKRVNIGCGQTPTKGWNNYDNSLALIISNSPVKYFFLKKMNLLSSSQIKNIEWNRRNKISFVNATKKLPFETNEIQCIYSCHMLEHLSRKSAAYFLKECLRTLSNNGILRLVLPDLKYLANNYLKYKDADIFLENSFLIPPPLETFQDKLKLLVIGYRHHQWMYDSKSLTKKILEIGFRKVVEQEPGKTLIDNYGELDLFERSRGSIFIEALK